MKRLITTLPLLITIFLTNDLHAQVLKKKAFKDASTIRLYVTDLNEDAAIERFTEFINKTKWTVQPSLKLDDVNSAQRDDTMFTDVGSLFDFMMGEFQGQLKFYADRDSSNKIYIAVSGYASALSWGGSGQAQMKKRGSDTNWSQRAMFKQVDKHLSDFSDVDMIRYSDE
ncbi:MAG: hypothetical protein ABR574_07775 [Cryomorphaceae bacterium]|nr:hypothetical protein [Flavobacteriales bacterium]